MRDLNQEIAKLSPEKRALLESLLIKNNDLSVKEQGIPRREESESYPLSFAQQRLWFLDQFYPDSGMYNISSALLMKGALHVEALQNALNAIVARHESLRTTFVSVDGIPNQVIAKIRKVDFSVTDLSSLADTEREAAVQRLLEAESSRPFDLSGDLMLRSILLKLSVEEHIFLVVVHHIASDGWSMGVFRRELLALYEAFSTGKPSPLPELPIQYADFAVWQREWLQGEVLESQLAYWREQLAGAPPVLELPTDRHRPSVLQFRGASHPLALSSDLTEKLNVLSQREGATLFMTLLSAFALLLYRYTGQEDIVIGSPIANRNRVEVEKMIGFFVNTLVMRTDLSGSPTFLELLGRVREACLEAYDHQDIPFENLVEELSPERNMNRNPLFQILFVLQNAPRTELKFHRLAVAPLKIANTTTKFDLTLSLTETDHGLTGRIEYDKDLFDETTIARMAVHLETLLESIAADPKRQISGLALLAESEKRQLLVEWNDTQKTYLLEKCVHHFFEEQAERTPDAVAAVFEGQELTYGELNIRANQLAHHLQTLGVGPDAPVGICVERSLEMVVGLLGILKAGGAYVPLDPAYPKERLGFMLSDSQASVLLTQKRILEQLPEHELQVICLDTDRRAAFRENIENPMSGVTAQNLAYVSYTSGSTGHPKGVAMEHRPLTNLLFWQLQSPTFFGAARVLQFASLSFDVSFQEMFSTWASGGTLVLISDETRKDAQALLNVLVEERIERLFFPFVALQQLAKTSEDSGLAPASLREVIAAGEQLQITPAIVDLFKRLGSCILRNDYGPAESHVVTSYTLTGPASDWPVLPPIGRAISNTQIYILNRCRQVVPIGVPGELYIAGICLARGYHYQPELTAEKFVSNPFSDEAEARLYKTGDLARYLPDGNIEFLGRIDNQVKIRAFRVELGEIETVLGKHPAVRQAVVVAEEDESGINKRLIAYVVPDKEHSPNVSVLHQFLKEKLPDYMIPAAFILLDALPLTPSGKIDRRSLPAPDITRPELAEVYVPPRTPTEQQIADIWAKILRLERVGVHDNFFELGGHSLLATQVVSQLRKAFQIELPLRDLFAAPRVAELAKHVESLSWIAENLQAASEDVKEHREKGSL